jgi:hypothetical protein
MMVLKILKNQFQILSEVNGWNYNIKSLSLASSLKGAARAILNELDGDKRRDYDSLVLTSDHLLFI